MMDWLAPTGLVVGLGAWWKGLLNQYIPCPERVWLALVNNLWGQLQPVEDHFSIVLCWLDNDRNGGDTRHVAEAFTSVEGVALVRSACILAASAASEIGAKRCKKKLAQCWKNGMLIWLLSA